MEIAPFQTALARLPRRRTISHMLQDILKAKEILLLLIQREFRARYAGSNFGILWNLLHPVIMVVVYILVFSRLMGEKVGADSGSPVYMIHLTAGIIPWLMFSEIVTRSVSVLVENGEMLKKMALPEEVLFLSVFFTSFIVYSIAMGALVVFLLIMGVPVSPHVFFAFPVMMALGLSAVGAGMFLSVLNLLIRDVGQVVNILLQLGFWSLPIVYFPSILSERMQDVIAINPIRGFFALIQKIFGSPEAAFNPDTYWMMTLLPFACLVMGISFLRNHRSEILDAL